MSFAVNPEKPVGMVAGGTVVVPEICAELVELPKVSKAKSLK